MHPARLAVSVCLAALLAGCQGPYLTEEAYYVDGPPTPLTGEEIRAALVGNSIVSDAPDGPFHVYFPDEERVVGRHSNHYADTGTWRVTEEGMCARWDNWWGNVERCWTVVRDGDAVSWLDPYGDSISEGVTIVEGNVAGL